MAMGDISQISQPSQANTYLGKSYSALDAYYKQLLDQENGDVNRAIERLKSDYTRGLRINTEDYSRNQAFGQESANASYKEEAMNSESENRKLEADMIKRGISVGGVAQQQQGMLKDRQQLRREAIDRALKKSNEDLKYSYERGNEEEGLKQGRGIEDLASEALKFKTDKGQERVDKAQQLAEADYGREFNRQATEKGFDFSQQSLNKMG